MVLKREVEGREERKRRRRDGEAKRSQLDSEHVLCKQTHKLGGCNIQ